MIINNAVNYRIDRRKHKQEYMSLNAESHLTPLKNSLQYNYQDIKRPLKQNPQDLSFKGLSIRYKDLEKVYSKSEFFQFIDKLTIFKNIDDVINLSCQSIAQINDQQFPLLKKN